MAETRIKTRGALEAIFFGGLRVDEKLEPRILDSVIDVCEAAEMMEAVLRTKKFVLPEDWTVRCARLSLTVGKLGAQLEAITVKEGEDV